MYVRALAALSLSKPKTPIAVVFILFGTFSKTLLHRFPSKKIKDEKKIVLERNTICTRNHIGRFGTRKEQQRKYKTQLYMDTGQVI